MKFCLLLTRYIGCNNLLRRSLRYHIFCKIKKDFNFKVNFYGYIYNGNLDNYIDRSVFFFGAHEREQMIFSRRYINNGVVVDCGANSGNHSLFYSAFSKKVLSIEANPILALEIKNRISMNSITNITLCNIGVGSRDETQRLFYQATGDNKGVSSFVKNFHEQNRNVVNIRIQTLDSILSELRVSNVDFIKIDVEGFDYETLKGAHKTISRCSPVIQIEYAPRDKSKMTTFLRENPRYLPRSLIVNRPFFVFNRPRGILVEWDPDFRSEVFLIPK